MSKPQLRVRVIKRSMSSKRRDTTIFGKMDSKAVCAASPRGNNLHIQRQSLYKANSTSQQTIN